MICLDDFHPLSLDDKPLFDEVYRQYPPVHSDYVFTTMISWMHYAHYHMCHHQQHILLYTTINESIRFRPPLGPPDKQVLYDVIQLSLKEGNPDTPFGMIDAQQQNVIGSFYPTLSFEPHPDYFDYVYTTQDLVALEGSPYRKIRNRLNKFINTCSYTTEVLSEKNLDEVLAFLKRWCLWKDCASHPFLKHERQAILYAMNHYIHLGLQGLCIRVNDAIEAVAVYEQMNPSTAVIHFEKGSPDYDGIYKAINWETAKQLQDDVQFLNRESDMGEPGLRRAKQSYRPHHQEEVYHVSRDILVQFIE